MLERPRQTMTMRKISTVRVYLFFDLCLLRTTTVVCESHLMSKVSYIFYITTASTTLTNVRDKRRLAKQKRKARDRITKTIYLHKHTISPSPSLVFKPFDVVSHFRVKQLPTHVCCKLLLHKMTKSITNKMDRICMCRYVKSIGVYRRLGSDVSYLTEPAATKGGHFNLSSNKTRKAPSSMEPCPSSQDSLVRRPSHQPWTCTGPRSQTPTSIQSCGLPKRRGNLLKPSPQHEHAHAKINRTIDNTDLSSRNIMRTTRNDGVKDWWFTHS